MKYATDLTKSDRELVGRLQDFVPPVVFDVHIHPVHHGHYPSGQWKFLEGQAILGRAEHRTALLRYMPVQVLEGLYFGLPHPQANRRALNAWVAEDVAQVSTTANRALLLVAPEDEPAEVAAQLRPGHFSGLKVYHSFVRGSDTMAARIREYAPEWMWEVVNEVRGVLMLHLVRENAVADAENQRDLRSLCRAYPEVRVVLAHIGRSFNYRHARIGLRSIVDLENVVVDTSAIAECDAFRVALEVLGPRRVLWGSDYPVSETRGRCVATGNRFYWIHPEWVQLNPIAEMTLVGIESLLCLREACEDKGMTKGDIEDIFCNNAFRLLRPTVPRTGSEANAGAGPKSQYANCGTGAA